MGGHLFPVWLRFKGGRGVATGLGILAVLHWPAAAVGAGVFLIVFLATRYVSVGSLAGATVVPFAAWFLRVPLWDVPEERALVVGLAGAAAALIWWRHRENLGRLRRGEEKRIAWPRKSS